jgi:hypothetical protein
MLALLACLALAGPDRLSLRADAGLGPSTEGGAAVRLGIAPELWWPENAVGMRLSFDGDLGPGILSGEIDFLRAEPYAVHVFGSHRLVGLGLGAAWARMSPGFGLWSRPHEEDRAVATASLLAGWVSSERWFAVWLRVDGSTWPTASASLGLSVAPGLRVGDAD